MTHQDSYDSFLKSKVVTAQEFGFDVSESNLSQNLFLHQKKIVRWALAGGRRAIFASFGLGKTLIQLEIHKQVMNHEEGRCLIICPLGVKQEFAKDCGIIDLDKPRYITCKDDYANADDRFFITNYERVRDGDINPADFVCVTLDEASVLRGYGTKTYQTFLQMFGAVKYRFVATATPSPNRYKELIHYAGFLGVMDTGQSLTRFFKRDSQKANNLTIHPHKEKEFWLWVSSWAVLIYKPSDIGCSDKGYNLPEIKVIEHRLKTDHSKAGFDSWGQGKMFKDKAKSLSDSAKVKRDSLRQRLDKALEIVGENPDDHYLLWHHLEYERGAIEKEVSGAETVYGSQDMDQKESLLIGFSDGEYKILATKPKIAGSGCNFQAHCHKAIFLGIDHKFNDFIQAVHRIYRFGQSKPVEIHVIYMEEEDNVWNSLQHKWDLHENLQTQMREIVAKYGLNQHSIMAEMQRSIGIERREVVGKNFVVANNDCVLEARLMEDDSVHLIHTSIPFSNHYEYTPSYNDMGHNENDDRFFEQLGHLTKELYRILMPGRIAAIHVKNRIQFGNVTGVGFPTVNPFSHRTVFHYMEHGFQFMGEIIVLTDVVRENAQTYRLGWSENAKDSTKMGVGCPEYVLLFRKPQTDTSRGYADLPVTKDKSEYSRGRWQVDAHSFWRSRGDRFLKPEELAEMPHEKIYSLWKDYSRSHEYDFEEHVQACEGLDEKGRLPSSHMIFDPKSWSEWIWDDVNRMRTLNMEQSKRNQENHICPLQFDIVKRIIERYTNKGELVFDPFGGLMTVPYMAIELGRKGRASELNPQYFDHGVNYLKAMEYKLNIPTLFSCA